MSLNRPIHYLRGNASCRTPRRALFFHCESYTSSISEGRETHTLRVWVACFVKYVNGKPRDEVWKSGETGEEFIAFLFECSNSRETLWVFADELAFDWTLVGGWDLLQSSKCKLETCVIESPPVIFAFYYGKCRVRLVDIANYWDSDIEEIAESISYPRSPLPDNAMPCYEWTKHAAGDVSVVSRVVSSLIAMVQERNLGNFGSTASAISWSAYRHRFMRHRILIHNDEDATELERDACHGGRCEVWRIGEIRTPITVLDCNSLYPSVMMNHAFPVKLLDYAYGASVKEIDDMLGEGFGIIANVRIDSMSEFPVHRAGGVQFCTGKFSTVLCGPELRRAIDTDAISGVHEFSVYKMDYIFSDFVEYFYLLRMELRLDGDKAGESLCKKLLNSLWGKFQQRSHSWVNRPKETPEGAFSQWTRQRGKAGPVSTFRSVAWLVQELTERGEGDNSFPAVGAHVLACGRERLRELRLTAGVNNCYYCDTDSIHCSHDGLMRLAAAGETDKKALGKMKWLGTFADAEYYGQKDYRLGDMIVLAGRKAEASGSGRGRYEQQEIQGAKSLVHSYPGQEVVETRRTLIRSVKPIRGVVRQDGFVLPETLRE